MKISERMRRKGWRFLGEACGWTKRLGGLYLFTHEQKHGDWFVFSAKGETLAGKPMGDTEHIGVRSCAQRAEAAARKLARGRGGR
ncbi:MAG: hypothetical protein EKK55_16845 [Rhodocyclaceae bacterium]|nr:MAG: hypothetical protein EKK55_16845 [Rhodocyclaceae bacterium]